MKRALIVVIAVLAVGGIARADSAQYGRIVLIKKSYSSYTKSYINSTPVMGDITTYTISVQVGNSLIVGNYDLSADHPEPPPDWVKGYAVTVQVDGQSMRLRSPTGQLFLHVKQRKNGRPMDPLTAEEKKRLDELDTPLKSMIGLASPQERPSAGNAQRPATSVASEVAPEPPPSPLPPTGTLSVRSTPYLSEVFVDGESTGYTPTKVALPPGKHKVRIEKPGYKPWTTEMTITVNTEQSLDATLTRK